MTSLDTERTVRVVLGVSGGVAAYKSVELLRRLTARGYFVSPVLTEAATRFVGAATFSALASEPARTSLFGDPRTPIPHTTLGRAADLVVVAPATAHLVARYATGLADDLLTATLLATRAPVVLCPAMHPEMWAQPATQAHLATLRARGVVVLDPAEGPLAGGDEGVGRMREPEEIDALVATLLGGDGGGPLAGRTVLVAAGGTREPIDPVRVITNRSSGRQGHAVASVAARRGARVVLVTASALPTPSDVATRIERVPVETAREMAEAVLNHAPHADIIVMAAAVSDFTVHQSPTKLRRLDGPPTLTLSPTTDILAAVVAGRRAGQVVVGFAAETDDVLARGLAKRRAKGCDLLVVNDVTAPGAGFNHTTNAVTLIGPGDTVTDVPLTSKEAVAAAIFDNVAAINPAGDP